MSFVSGEYISTPLHFVYQYLQIFFTVTSSERIKLITTLAPEMELSCGNNIIRTRHRFPSLLCALASQSYSLKKMFKLDRKTDIYFIDKKKVNPDLFVIEIRETFVHVCTTLLIS